MRRWKLHGWNISLLVDMAKIRGEIEICQLYPEDLWVHYLYTIGYTAAPSMSDPEQSQVHWANVAFDYLLHITKSGQLDDG